MEGVPTISPETLRAARLAELRRIQMDRNFTPDELEEFQNLSREAEGGLTAAEEADFIELSRRQTTGDNWTSADATRVAELLRKKEKRNK